ncbi:hypothetical protein [Alkalicoccobacillus plakortidis]|uniref:Uncharacterized protein n=1 Tax=Alkalicoccobacillus plakortidis TaxID=444060 RepID=A0ABT0XEW9_9BACI|nr:hypothetical protein [Alkalicoccobacillus plakortidis]MCM2674446.1 hypothetical protein [Alkalicoccobacillus plakortidis]
MPLTDKQIQTLKQDLLDLKKNLEGNEGFTTDFSESTGEVSNGVDNHMADQAAQYEDRMKEQTFQACRPRKTSRGGGSSAANRRWNIWIMCGYGRRNSIRKIRNCSLYKTHN